MYNENTNEVIFVWRKTLVWNLKQQLNDPRIGKNKLVLIREG